MSDPSSSPSPEKFGSTRNLLQHAERLMSAVLGTETTVSLATRLAADSIGTYVLRIVAATCSLGIGMALARMLGVDGFGAYTYVIAWASSLHVLAACGLDRLLIRNVASYAARAEWVRLRSLLQWSMRTAFLISCITAGIVGLVAGLFFHTHDTRLLSTFWLGLLLVPVLTINLLRQAAMQGLHRVIPGQLPDRVIQPVLIMALIGLSYWLLGGRFQPTWALGVTAVGALGACGLGFVQLFRALPAGMKDVRACGVPVDWKTSVYPLAWVSWASIAADQADILLLGLLGGVDAVGIYSVGIRGVRIIAFSLIAVNTALAPTAARLYALGEIQRLHRIAVRSSRVVLILAIPLAVGLALLRHFYLGLFGPAFIEGERVLLILVCGQLCNAAAGSGGLLLIATGHERDVAFATALSAIVQLGLCLILIPSLGATGAALSRVSTIASLNIILAVFVHRRLGINCFAFARCPSLPK